MADTDATKFEELDEKYNNILDFSYQVKKITANELLDAQYPEPTWVVDKLIPDGFTILAGPPQAGKSWLVLGLAAACAVGGRAWGHYSVQPMHVLYVGLEESERRLQKRYMKIGGMPTDNLMFYTDFPKGPDGISYLHKHLEFNPQTKLVIIDPLIHFMPAGVDFNQYSEVYPVLDQIVKLAREHDISVIAVHHSTKRNIGKGLNMLGSQAFRAAADSTVTFERRATGEAGAFLEGEGRDIESWEIALQFDDNIGWKYLGAGDDFRASDLQKAIIEALEEADDPLKAHELAQIVDENPGSVRVMLSRLYKKGKISKKGYGKYGAL